MREPGKQAVVITGASSGIGRATALRLAREGFRVFAGVRKASDADSLQAESGGAVTPIEIDVTDGASIGAAAREVEAQLAERGLDGLVNNAGIGLTGAVEYLQPEALRRQFEVNVFGQIAVTQAFLPLIRRARGRIVNIGSVGSHLAIPFGGALCASKSALTMLNDALRLELRPFGIHVALIEPGAISTPAMEKTLGNVEAVIGSMPSEGVARYGEALREFTRRGYQRESAGSSPGVVADAVYRALTARRPRLRYVVGAEARKLTTVSRLLPARLLDRARLKMLGLPLKFGSSPATA